jgi:glycosyltransferase involved in cell wall biosynthesis
MTPTGRSPAPLLRSLYLCYLSLEDPLVDSQVIAYLEGLAENGHTIHLVTFEGRRLTPARRRELRGALRSRGILWHGLRYHKRPSLPATAFDTLVGAAACAWLVRRHRLQAVHARNHVPAAMAMLAAPLAPHRLIFDIRGLMAEEYVDAGRWPRGGLAFRITKRVERAAKRRAAGTVVLTQRVRRALFGEEERAGVFVIPCCADVERLEAQRAQRNATRSALRLGDRPVTVYVGKFGGWYMGAEMVDFFAVARDVIPGLHFLVITQADRSAIEPQFARRAIASADYTIMTAEHARLGEFLAVGDFALAMIKPLPSKVASSPTKIGECLSAGLPVLATDVGDVKELLTGSRAGLVLEQFSEQAYRSAARGLAELLADEGTSERCVASAHAHLSLRGTGIPGYVALYRFVAGRRDVVAPGEQPPIEIVDAAHERLERERLG